MLSITDSLMLMTALFNGGIAVFVLRGNPRSATNLLLGVYLAVLSAWALALIGTQIGNNYELWLYSTKFTYAAGLVIAASFYLFTIVFPRDTRLSPKQTVGVYAATAAFILPLFLFPGFLTERIVQNDWGNGAVLHVTEFLIFVALFCFLYIGGLVRIWLKYFKSEGEYRSRLLLIGLGVTITGVSGLYFDIILASPFINEFRYIWTGPLLNTCMAVLIMYAVFRFKLFNAKVIATEILISLLWIFTFLRTLLASDQREQLLNGGLFIFSFIIGFLLVRSVRREVEQREEIQRLSDEKSEFMTFASHEIRNPITAMRGYASLISDGTTGDASAATKDAAEKILVTGNEVLMLIAQFLSKSKFELGKIEYLIAPFDAACAVSMIADGYLPHAKQKGITLEKRIDTSKKVLIKGDEGKFKEVVANLIDNSLKYTREGSITVTVWQDTKRARIVIEDTGVGIPAETLPQLFKKFSRADAQKVNLLGTGIGLFLAKTFIEGQGGTIRAESAGKDKGSRFIIEFPLA